MESELEPMWYVLRHVAGGDTVLRHGAEFKHSSSEWLAMAAGRAGLDDCTHLLHRDAQCACCGLFGLGDEPVRPEEQAQVQLLECAGVADTTDVLQNVF